MSIIFYEENALISVLSYTIMHHLLFDLYGVL